MIDFALLHIWNMPDKPYIFLYFYIKVHIIISEDILIFDGTHYALG